MAIAASFSSDAVICRSGHRNARWLRIRRYKGSISGSRPSRGSRAATRQCIKIDAPAATELFAKWPTDIYISGFEVGRAVLYPAVSIEHDFPAGNPVAEGDRFYMKMPYDRPSWDLTTVLYDLRPDRGYFDLSPAGDVTVAPDGSTSFQPNASGKRYFMKIDATQAAMIRDACIWLATQPK